MFFLRMMIPDELRKGPTGDSNRAFQSVVFNSGQKMALRAFYFIRALTKALTY